MKPKHCKKKQNEEKWSNEAKYLIVYIKQMIFVKKLRKMLKLDHCLKKKIKIK